MTQWPTTISQYMTPGPHSIGRDQPLLAARDLMQAEGIRHLPVLHGGRLVGLLSSRDVDLVTSFGGVDPARVTVEEAMSPEPYAVGPDTELVVVAKEMAERRLGSAVVTSGNRVVGVFTTVDALRALADALLHGK